MNNSSILVKVRQRLNKLSSFDYDNIEDWMVLEAFNKVQLETVRRLSIKGESTKETIEDIQVFLKNIELKGTNKPNYFESINLPSDVVSIRRVSPKANTKDCSDLRQMVSYLVEEYNIDILLKDPLKNPNFEWAETIHTLVGNKIRIYTNDQFNIQKVDFLYYRKPLEIKIVGVFDLESQRESDVEQLSEFKDDFIENNLIPETCLILAGDIENSNQVQRNTQFIQRNLTL